MPIYSPLTVMALWTDNTKCMLVWRSGLQYQATIASSAPLASILSTIRSFYESNNAVLQTTGAGMLIFKRGKGWRRVSAWILPASEKRLPQTITVSASQAGDMSLIDISYDVRVSFLLFVAPNQLVKEVQNLRSLLSETSSRLKAA